MGAPRHLSTVVEVKRGADTRVRREVVGQMLDYAANASTTWSMEDLLALSRETESILRTEEPPWMARGQESATDGWSREARWLEGEMRLPVGRAARVDVKNVAGHGSVRARVGRG